MELENKVDITMAQTRKNRRKICQGVAWAERIKSREQE